MVASAASAGHIQVFVGKDENHQMTTWAHRRHLMVFILAYENLSMIILVQVLCVVQPKYEALLLSYPFFFVKLADDYTPAPSNYKGSPYKTLSYVHYLLQLCLYIIYEFAILTYVICLLCVEMMPS